jgi:Fe-S cluster assembly iron-binding protein IscA
MALDEPNDEVKTHTVNEIKIMISDEILPFTEGNMLDYVSDHRGEGFMMGPVEPKDDCSDCGCGCE